MREKTIGGLQSGNHSGEEGGDLYVILSSQSFFPGEVGLRSGSALSLEKKVGARNTLVRRRSMKA